MDGFPGLDCAEADVPWVLRQAASHAFEERYIEQEAVNSFFAHDWNVLHMINFVNWKRS